MVFGIQVFNLEHDPAGKTIVYRTSNLSSAGEMYGKTVRDYGCTIFDGYPLIANRKDEKGNVLVQVSLINTHEDEYDSMPIPEEKKSE